MLTLLLLIVALVSPSERRQPNAEHPAPLRAQATAHGTEQRLPNSGNTPDNAADPLLGRWALEAERSYYGGGARRRKEETFECAGVAARRQCTVRSRFADGSSVEATFTASYDGTSHPVRGLPDVDEVRLRQVDDFVADATFSYRGRPAFGYRAVLSDNRRHLTFIAVDPVSRAVLQSVVVYRRQ